MPTCWGALLSNLRSELDLSDTLFCSFLILSIIAAVSTVAFALIFAEAEQSTFFFKDCRMATSSERADSKESAGPFCHGSEAPFGERVGCFENCASRARRRLLALVPTNASGRTLFRIDTCGDGTKSSSLGFVEHAVSMVLIDPSHPTLGIPVPPFAPVAAKC